MFDICSCFCPPILCQNVRCKTKKCNEYHLDCYCDIKVLKPEAQFLLDQRGENKIKIAGIDLKVIRMWEKVTTREIHNAERLSKQFEQRKRGLVPGEVPCEGDNFIDASDIFSCNTDDDL